ncbi:MBL fold metallo-hydrolase [Emcibacter nanhaiensis]|uniref:MBL fold metallo-hydrolase n=1 Tax=Emcibacter nanhaiensis TaxID=1505037 RepID=A0A501PG98_9PROT|nr:MBL fold metallo-hydrolase [Emcibacter nanhaiensis]TPD59480.1 MBL fold metallo-hydrolase [Emcibacter nanhaiensis]
MPVTNSESGTSIDEIASGIYRISTPVPPSEELPPGFSFNQYLIAADKPLLYHTGLKGLYPLTAEAIATVMPLERLRYISFSHVESDECGALNEFLEAAPGAVPLCSELAAMVSIGDMAIRPPQTMADGETVELGPHRVTWIATPHFPHAWECGHLYESSTGTLFCGDLFTQFGNEHPAVTDQDILEPAEQARAALDYYSHTKQGPALMDKLVATRPGLLACMHGAAWQGDGAALLQALGDRLEA